MYRKWVIFFKILSKNHAKKLVLFLKPDDKKKALPLERVELRWGVRERVRVLLSVRYKHKGTHFIKGCKAKE